MRKGLLASPWALAGVGGALLSCMGKKDHLDQLGDFPSIFSAVAHSLICPLI